LLDVDEIKYVPKGIDRAGRAEMLVYVGNHFKSFPSKQLSSTNRSETGVCNKMQ
jgi:hypothetical protein